MQLSLVKNLKKWSRILWCWAVFAFRLKMGRECHSFALVLSSPFIIGFVFDTTSLFSNLQTLIIPPISCISTRKLAWFCLERIRYTLIFYYICKNNWVGYQQDMREILRIDIWGLVHDKHMLYYYRIFLRYV